MIGDQIYCSAKDDDQDCQNAITHGHDWALPQMHPNELEWKHIKKEELSGQMFDDELQLAYAVINVVKDRVDRKSLEK